MQLRSAYHDLSDLRVGLNKRLLHELHFVSQRKRVARAARAHSRPGGTWGGRRTTWRACLMWTGGELGGRGSVWWVGEGREAMGKFEAPAQCSIFRGCPAQKIEQGPSRPSPIPGQSGAFAEQLGDNCCLQTWAALPFLTTITLLSSSLPFRLLHLARGCRVSESIWLELHASPHRGRYQTR